MYYFPCIIRPTAVAHGVIPVWYPYTNHGFSLTQKSSDPPKGDRGRPLCRWRLQPDLNRRHPDRQSGALAAELWSRIPKFSLKTWQKDVLQHQTYSCAAFRRYTIAERFLIVGTLFPTSTQHLVGVHTRFRVSGHS